MANTSYSPMDFNQDGNVSNLELAAAVNEVNELSGKKKNPLLGRILFGAVVLLIGLTFIAVGWVLFDYRMTDVAVIGVIVSILAAAYMAWILIRWHKMKRKGVV